MKEYARTIMSGGSSRTLKGPAEVELQFGKHRGKTLREIWAEEPGYLLWLVPHIQSGTFTARHVTRFLNALREKASCQTCIDLGMYCKRRGAKDRRVVTVECQCRNSAHGAGAAE